MKTILSIKPLLILMVLIFSPLAFGQEICDNGIDDDGDGLIDLNDTTECFCDTISSTPSSLIPNPSFEDTSCCPGGLSQLNCATGWIQASTPTSDYYNSCDTNVINFGPEPEQPLPGGGNGYVGIIVSYNWSEYMGSCLPTALSANVSYTINFFTAYSQGETTRTFAIYGSQTCAELPWAGTNCPTDFSSNWVLLDSIEVVYNSITGGWQAESMTFTPDTDIQAIAIGATCLDNFDNGSYYYFDELTINSTVSFSSNIPIVGDICDNNEVMFTPDIPGAIGVQWYKEGIAILGENGDSLDPDGYGLGLYTVVVTDSLGNCYTMSREIYDPFITINNITSNPPCFGFLNGEINLQGINGADSIYNVIFYDNTGSIISQDSIENGNSILFDELSNGTYTIVIEGIRSCIYDSTFLLDGDVITLNTTVGDLLCYEVHTGSIVVNSSTILDSIVITDANGVVMNTIGTNVANNLAAGQYIISVVNDNGCSAQFLETVNQPNEMDIIFNLTQNKCHGDQQGIALVDTVYNYGGDYGNIFYQWTPNPNGTNGLNETSSAGLEAGQYVLELIDDNGCNYSQIFSITEPIPLAGILTVESPTYCRTAGFQSGNGLVSVTTAPDSSGTGSVNYQWVNTNSGQTTNSSTFVVRSPGWMRMTMIDANDCIFTDSVYVDSLNPIADFLVTSNAFTTPSIYEGTGPLNADFENLSVNFYQQNNPNSDSIFLWNLFENDPVNNNWFISTDYDEKIDTTYEGDMTYNVCLVAKNFNDCADTTCKIINVFADPFLETPNVFTPGGAPNNTFFFPSAGIKDFNCIVMNRYGVEVFKFNDIEMQWDGTHFKTGKPCTDGTYFYVYGAGAVSYTHLTLPTILRV